MTSARPHQRSTEGSSIIRSAVLRASCAKGIWSVKRKPMEPHMENQDGNGKAGYFLLLGIGIGAVVSLLFAPRTGHEIRHAIREKTDKGREALGRRSQQLSEVARSAIDK